ncbi:hypothetical protein WJX74_006261 [Apatococcus lobatus]|uniref:Uncharacterized protein n=1 Tax=Apatococcus lobatus TaxID=904363 RepID=A0AAW1QW99_9CHLO
MALSLAHAKMYWSGGDNMQLSLTKRSSQFPEEPLKKSHKAYKVFAGAEPSFEEIYVVDPKLLLQPGLWEEQQAASGRSPAVSLSIPSAFQPQLSQGKQELGEGDVPENSWFFAKKGDLFEYTFRGSFPVVSGYASLVHSREIDSFLKDGLKPNAAWWTWDEFKRHFRDDMPFPQGGHFPVLFAGRIVEAASASLFSIGQGTTIQGLQISGDSEEID